jgi:hypothetical protein
MQPDWPVPTTPAAVGQHVVAVVELFNKQHPLSNEKNWNDLTLRFVRWVQQLEPMLALDGLLWVLEHHSEYQIQMLVGELLQRASVGCPIPLDDLLSRLLPGFEESARSIPIYLRGVFGKDAVLSSLGRLEEGGAHPALAEKIQTMRFWIVALDRRSR